jgi:hypothetical protein
LLVLTSLLAKAELGATAQGTTPPSKGWRRQDIDVVAKLLQQIVEYDWLGKVIDGSHAAELALDAAILYPAHHDNGYVGGQWILFESPQDVVAATVRQMVVQEDYSP